MAQTIIGVNDSKAVKRWSGSLAVDAPRKAYFLRKYMGKGDIPTKPIWQLTDLEQAAGEVINYDLSMQLNMQPVEGDAELHGKEEALQWFSDSVYIDQMRGGVDTGGRMTKKRTLHDTRQVAKARSSDWWGRAIDQLFFIYLSGARGVNNFIFPTTYSAFAGNTLTSPDTNHMVYGGVATSSSTLAATDTMSTLPIDRGVAYAEAMGDDAPFITKVPMIQKCDVDGEDLFLLIMSPYQKFNLRRNTTTNDWADIQKALAISVGLKSEFVKGGLGIWNGVLLQSHAHVIKFNNYGTGGNVAAARALMLGLQAGVIAWGSPGNDMRFGWNEEPRDNNNRTVISTHSILGIKKVTFNGNDFGVMAIDTANPTP